jgi:hypothetical protein
VAGARAAGANAEGDPHLVQSLRYNALQTKRTSGVPDFAQTFCSFFFPRSLLSPKLHTASELKLEDISSEAQPLMSDRSRHMCHVYGGVDKSSFLEMSVCPKNK